MRTFGNCRSEKINALFLAHLIINKTNGVFSLTSTKISIINEIQNRIISNIHPESIILFGSTAKGIDKEDSDIDLLIVWDEQKDMPNIKRRIMLRKIIGITESPIDIITCTTDELKAALRDKNSFTYQIVNEGEVLYGGLN